MGIFFKNRGYKNVSQDDEDKATLLFQDHIDRKYDNKSGWKTWTSRFLWFMSVLTNVALASTLVALVYKPRLLKHSQTVDEAFTYRSASFDTVSKQLNGTFFPTANMSWSRMAPSPEVDESWEWFTPPRFFPLSETDLKHLGKDPTTAAKFPKEWNMPEGSYFGAVDLFHKMHCLSELRRAAFELHPYPSGGPQKKQRTFDEMDWYHLRHCTDMIAQDLQCNAKLDVMTFNYVDTQANIYADFSINRTCTNWDQFLDWNEKNTVDSRDYPSMIEHPKDAPLIPYQDYYYQRFGFGGSVLFPNGEGWAPSGN